MHDGEGPQLPAGPDTRGNTAEDEEEDWHALYYKTRVCKNVLLEGCCAQGDKCFYAHSPDEIRQLPPDKRPVLAAHWQGSRICIGVVEHAMFWDLPPRGTLDVVCNRASCLGNPFGGRRYREGETRAAPDAEGWRPAEHEEICAAFAEYLEAILEEGSEESISSIVGRIASARGCYLVDAWMGQGLEKADVLAALGAVAGRAAAGERVRLLCHCRPHVRCHTELLKAHLERRLPGVEAPPVASLHPGWKECLWPSLGGDQPLCGARQPEGGSCTRVGRALNPGDMQLYCPQCWVRRVNLLKGTWDNRAKPKTGGEWVDPPKSQDKAIGRCRKFQSTGYCIFGKDCWYSHDSVEQDPQVLQRPACYFYARGWCKYGAQCHFRHCVEEAEPAGSTTAAPSEEVRKGAGRRGDSGGDDGDAVMQGGGGAQGAEAPGVPPPSAAPGGLVRRRGEAEAPQSPASTPEPAWPPGGWARSLFGSGVGECCRRRKRARGPGE